MQTSQPYEGATQIMSRVGIWTLRAIAALLIIGSIASSTDLEQWWIRIWDFPRLQIFFALVLCGVLLWLLDKPSRPWFTIVVALCAAWQFYRIYPYTFLEKLEVAKFDEGALGKANCFSVMSFNVLQDNRDYDRTLRMIEREKPDILLLLETDEKWQSALAPVLADYPYREDRPIANTYGLMFASRFPISDSSIQDLTEKDTPSIYASLDIDGRLIRMIGIHPRPPHPGQDTDERDAELVVVGQYAQQQDLPVIVIGDFNDVAWSNTSILFKRLSELLDPRIGRSSHATFPADFIWLAWPLDHLFVSDEFLLEDMRVLENVGSDHRAILSRLCLDPRLGDAFNAEAERADQEDHADAEEIVEKYVEDSVEDASNGE